MSFTCHSDTEREFAPASRKLCVSPTIPSPPYIFPNPVSQAERFTKSAWIFRSAISSVLDYLNALSTAFFVSRVSRSDIQGKKLLEIGEKVYFTDVGLRNSIAGFSPTDLGLIVENVIFNHLFYNWL
jgi:hypothetical protein